MESLQKSKSVTPRLACFTRRTLPVTHWSSPMCCRASVIGMQSLALEDGPKKHCQDDRQQSMKRRNAGICSEAG